MEEKSFEPLLIAGIRMKGKYAEIGAGFARLGKAAGRHICGKPLCLLIFKGNPRNYLTEIQLPFKD